MKVAKRLYTIVLAMTFLLSIGFFGANAAFAHNYGDSTFSFGFPPNSKTNQYTPTRWKEDSTSSYMKLQSIGGDLNPSYTASVVRGNKTNFSKTWYYTFSQKNINQGVYLKNYAYEDDGKTYVRIKATGYAVHGFYANGVWSPDSI